MRSRVRRRRACSCSRRAPRTRCRNQLIATFDEWRLWTVDVIESHLSYPLLFYFRSSHDNEAWANSFGAVMDAATLVLTTIDGGPVGNARLMHKVGSHFVADMRDHFRIVGEPVAGVEREEFLEACARLEHAGYQLHNLDSAWEAFSQMRSKYGAVAQPDDQRTQRAARALDRRSFVPAPPRTGTAGSRSAARGLRLHLARTRRIDGRGAADSAGNAGRCRRARSARRMIARPG